MAFSSTATRLFSNSAVKFLLRDVNSRFRIDNSRISLERFVGSAEDKDFLLSARSNTMVRKGLEKRNSKRWDTMRD